MLYRKNLANVRSFEPYQAFQHLSLFTAGSKVSAGKVEPMSENTNIMLDIKAITNFLESSMVPVGSTFTSLHPQHGSRLQQGWRRRKHISALKPGREEFVETVIYNHHIESILRRCDHDGDAELCYQEFYEVVLGSDDKCDLPLIMCESKKLTLSENDVAVEQLAIEVVKTDNKTVSNIDLDDPLHIQDLDAESKDD